MGTEESLYGISRAHTLYTLAKQAKVSTVVLHGNITLSTIQMQQASHVSTTRYGVTIHDVSAECTTYTLSCFLLLTVHTASAQSAALHLKCISVEMCTM
jgi:hypothetical protein